MKIARRVLGMLAGISMLVILLITSFEIGAYSDYNWYKKEYEKYDVLAELEMKMDDVMEVTKEMMSYLRGNREDLVVQTVVKGDSRSASIAAASVLAKVTRDDMMLEMAKTYPDYGFEIHKGYGTKAHYAALTEHGMCAAPRRSFLKKFYGEK